MCFIRIFCCLIFKLVLILNGIKEIIIWFVLIDDREIFDKLCSYLKNIIRGCFVIKEGCFCFGKFLVMFIFKVN